ncbi:MAG TPA: hypothetical protein VGQ76_07875 [Thermoanaerobaculia bacterium]|jgi:hypothetical protein|nr:hypothetical protein [Thermoanaerobaculia bacterium]
MLRNRRERGESQFGCLVGIIILLVAGVLAYKLIPIKVKAADLRDTVVNEAKSAGQHDERVIMKNILRKAGELEFPVTEENVKIKRSSTYVTIDVTYAVPVDLPGYKFNWNFHHHTENPVF